MEDHGRSWNNEGRTFQNKENVTEAPYSPIFKTLLPLHFLPCHLPSLGAAVHVVLWPTQTSLCTLPADFASARSLSPYCCSCWISSKFSSGTVCPAYFISARPLPHYSSCMRSGASCPTSTFSIFLNPCCIPDCGPNWPAWAFHGGHLFYLGFHFFFFMTLCLSPAYTLQAEAEAPPIRCA